MKERDGVSRAPAKDWQSIALVVFFAVASLRVSRLQSFFTIATVMLVGPSVATAWQRVSSRRVARVPSTLAAGFIAAIALAAIAGGVTVSARNLGCIRMDDQLFPEPDVARLAAERNLRGRMLTWFDWGEYAIWYFSPGVTVSIDGRRETVYSEEAINRHLTFYTSPDDRQAVLDTLAARLHLAAVAARSHVSAGCRRMAAPLRRTDLDGAGARRHRRAGNEAGVTPWRGALLPRSVTSRRPAIAGRSDR